jgi:O-antigen ligase
MLKTAVLMGWVGVAVSVILLIVFLVKKLAKVGRRVLLSFTVLLGIGVGSAACYFLPKIYDTQNYINFDNKIARDMVLYDTGVIWQDSNYRIFTSGYLIMGRESFNEEYNADMNYKEIIPTYKYQWSRTLKLICRTPYYLTFGVGPENIALALLGKSYNEGNHISFINNFDKPYNDYLYVIATRGIFSLLFYVIFLMLAFNSTKNRDKNKKQKNDFIKYACIVGAIIYLILSIIGFSNIEITPIFFILLGFAKSTTEKEEDTK